MVLSSHDEVPPTTGLMSGGRWYFIIQLLRPGPWLNPRSCFFILWHSVRLCSHLMLSEVKISKEWVVVLKILKCYFIPVQQFSGLTKEELLKYADDPFWVRLRWFMFIMFWALWLCMLAGAIGIIIQAPKCAAPTPKTWFVHMFIYYCWSCIYLEKNMRSNKNKYQNNHI